MNTRIEQLKEQLNHLINRTPSNAPVNPSMPEYEVSDTIPINFFIVLEDIQSGLITGNPLLQYAQKNIEILR